MHCGIDGACVDWPWILQDLEGLSSELLHH